MSKRNKVKRRFTSDRARRIIRKGSYESINEGIEIMENNNPMDIDTQSIISTSTMIKNQSNFELNPSYDQDAVQYGSRISGNPKIWQWKQVEQWLKNIGLTNMTPIFKDKDYQIDGDELLNINITSLFEEYPTAEILNIQENEASENPTIKKFFRFKLWHHSCIIYYIRYIFIVHKIFQKIQEQIKSI